LSPFALGIRENTRVTVTNRDVLFIVNRFFGARFVCTAVGISPVFYFYLILFYKQHHFEKVAKFFQKELEI
jgi:hypothetical protein